MASWLVIFTWDATRRLPGKGTANGKSTFSRAASMSDTKPVLASVESERAALGAVLVEEKHLAALQAHTRIEDFFLSSHREILRAVTGLKTQQKAADLVTVTEELRRVGKLDSVGGPVYVSSLIDSVPDRPNVEAYARNIRDASRARALHSAASLACTAIEQGEPVDEVLGRLQEKQESLARVYSS